MTAPFYLNLTAPRVLLDPAGQPVSLFAQRQKFPIFSKSFLKNSQA